MKKYQILSKLMEDKLVAVVRGDSAQEAEQIAEACFAGGVKAIELTFTLNDAADVIKKLAATYSDSDMLIGAGTVLDAETARIAILAGAQFIVSPGFDQDTAVLCHTYHIPYLPGCMTLTEMQTAVRAGIDLIKLFPGELAGPSYIKSVKGPLPDLQIMPTGGVDLNNLLDWFENGAVAVGIGSNLTSLKKLGSYQAITEQAQRYVTKVSSLGRDHS
ncbi:bifunctional 2-keto-4-hydroxyglutarate aldolase/2-keto-3-deoxy-6-phosphogluconate aldolase [Amphibacillus cookii]|uniref:bifunctional 2-keto-4-hydroxyglutarate aldolase/2-keto-3-deoxy-6-phosphogluconate aldolase n=1 Tax=Amphibacillus cookii TaxID=767787 RepID=UPI00195B9511|nr:bifunctional 2-keto-4-hydroxyglutarate aldolase/2-keto-3-deoxy-6-phosphogluconate aldolase [Amphibacillus cookii]MBM7541586.1 2-dehydro-3-deoxyphosphogluconate aldolase/(4S)-4-hydroxy-2-oxoglutarate aldolase [Amphibacillus cookii]